MAKAIKPDKLKDVNDRIFDLLAAGIYTTVTKAIREAISNSYDAGANNVRIAVDPKGRLESCNNTEVCIQIEDDGYGMSGDDFWEFYASMANPTKDPKKKDKKTGRYPIGKFGIGAFAFVPFVDEFRIYSKKDQESPIDCIVNCKKLRKTKGVSYRDHVIDSVTVNTITQQQWIKINSGKTSSGTIISIEGVRPEIHRQLVKGSYQFREKKPEEIFKTYHFAHFTDGLKEIAWDLSTMLPIPYDEGTTYNEYKKYLKTNNYPINIYFCGVQLKRKIFSVPGREVFTFEYNENGVVANGIVVANPITTKPYMAQGVMLRLNNVGIGNYDYFGYEGQKMEKSRVTGDIQIIKGLHDELESNRDGFLEHGDKFVDFNEEIIKKISEAAKKSKDLKSEDVQKKNEEKEKKDKDKKKVMYQQKKSGSKSKGSKKGKKEKKSKKDKIDDKKKDDKTDTKKDEKVEGEPEKEEVKLPISIVNDLPEYDMDHPLFKLYKSKKEEETIKNVLFALVLQEIDEQTFSGIVEHLIKMKG